MAVVTTSFTDVESLHNAFIDGPDVLNFNDSQWVVAFDEFFDGENDADLLESTSTHEVGEVPGAGTYELFGSNLLSTAAGQTGTVTRIIYTDNEPAATLDVRTAIAYDAFSGDIKRGSVITAIDYQAENYRFQFAGKAYLHDLDSGLISATLLSLQEGEGETAKGATIRGSFVLNPDTGAVLSGTVTSFELFFGDEAMSVTGVSLSAPALFADFSGGISSFETFLAVAFAGADTVTAAADSSTLSGFGGNDTYAFGSHEGVHVSEAAGGGTDTVRTQHSYTLDANVEHATLTGGGGNADLTGNNLGNTLTGDAEANVLQGLAGNDSLVGGAGNDELDGGPGRDVLNGGTGDDTLWNDLVGTGLSRAVLQDTMVESTLASGGIDTLKVRAGGADQAIFSFPGEPQFAVERVADAGNPIVGSWLIADAEITFVLTLMADGTFMAVEDSVDPLEPDGMERGTYAWDADTGEFTFETLVDTNGFDWGLSPEVVERMTVSGNVMTVDFAGGSDVDEVLVRVTSATNPLVGAWVASEAGEAQSDIVITFLANGQFLVAESGDEVADPNGQDGLERGSYTWSPATGAFDHTVTTNTNGEWGLSHSEIDSVWVQKGITGSPTIVLQAGIENLDLSATGELAINATGNAAANVLTGNAGNNVLNGAAGADTLVGLDGDDLFVLDQAGDVVVEEAGEGSDTVRIAYSIPATIDLNVAYGGNVENVVIAGTGAFNVTGNSADNALTGNASANVLIGSDGSDTLDGGAGNDVMIGGEGSDIYVVNAAGDVVVEGITQAYEALRASERADGGELPFIAGDATVSGDGRYVVFTAPSNDLVATNAGQWNHAFLKDLETGTVLRIDATAGLTDSAVTAHPVISADGKFVAFHSGEAGVSKNAFVWDVEAGSGTRVSEVEGVPNADSFLQVLTFLADGTFMTAEDASDPLEPHGMERGTYTWDAATGEFSFAMLVDTTGAGYGFSEQAIDRVTVSGNRLTIDRADNYSDLLFSRVTSATSPLVGA